ncbi:MAG: COG4223 family protein [Bdellovibrionales bacterium]
MTEKDQSQETLEEENPQGLERRRTRQIPLSIVFFLVLFAVIAGGAVGGYFIWTLPSGKVANLAITDRLDRLEQRVSLIEEKMGKESVMATATEAAKEPDTTTNDFNAVKGDLIDLAGALKGFESRLNDSLQKTENVKSEAQTGVATILAFVELRDAARSGLSFEKEISVLRDLVPPRDEKLNELIRLLEPYSMKGVATPETLHRAWVALAPQAQAAIRKSGVKTWQDRLVVALEDLISIRSLSKEQGKTLTFANIETDITAHKIASAIKKLDELSDDVKEVAKDWRIRAEERMKTDQFLDALAAQLILLKNDTTQPKEPSE